MRVNFTLRTPNNAQTAVLATLTYDANRLRVGTNLTVTAAQFDAKAQRLKKNTPESVEVNQSLTNFTNFVKDCYRRYRNDNNNQPPPPDWLKNEINIYLNGGKATKTAAPDLFTFIEKYIKTRTDLSEAQLRKYKNAFNHLRAFFAKSLLNPTFKHLNIDICLQFERFLIAPPYNLNPNSVGTIIKVFKHWLSEANQRGYFDNYSHVARKLKAKTNKADNIYLTLNELEQIANLDLSGKQGLSNARDLFLIGCFTGLRFSDFTQLTSANISEGVIRITQTKTKGVVYIPLHPIVETILHKNNGNPPRLVTNKTLNEHLKELGKLAGISEPTAAAVFVGNMVSTITRPKFQFIKTHTARRSFATNTYLNGLDIKTISEILGHTTIAQTQTYLKVSKEETAKRAAAHPFFARPQMQIAK